jgi:alkylation response protein AidB-like acyl-CoA dehydrogenase
MTVLRDRYAREYRTLMDSFASFVNRELVPLESETCDRTRDEPPPSVAGQVRRRSAELGFYAGDYPAEYGGQDMPLAAKNLLYEYAEASGCRLAPVALSQAEGPSELLLYGTPEQKERYLRPLVTGRATRCLAMSEPDSGSDALSPATRARPTASGGWRLSGQKTFVSNAADADFTLAIASVEADGAPSRPAVFIVEAGTANLVVGTRHTGLSDGAVHDLFFDDVELGPEALLGGPSALADGGIRTLRSLTKGRLIVAASANGIAAQALGLGVEFAKSRVCFGQRIGAYQHVQEHLVQAHARLESARLLVHAASEEFDGGADAAASAALAKWVATESAVSTVNGVFQVHGGAAWIRGHPMEYLYRRVRALAIVEGTTEIQKVIVSGSLGLG